MPTNSTTPGFGYATCIPPLYHAVTLDGVPQIPADVDWDIRRGFEPTPEQERRASAVIAAACLEIQRRDKLEKAGGTDRHEAMRLNTRKYYRQHTEQRKEHAKSYRQLGLGDRQADEGDEEAA